MNWHQQSGHQIGAGEWRRIASRFDWPLLLLVSVIVGVGLLNLYSATYRTPHSTKFTQQVWWVLVGISVFSFMTFLDYRTLIRLTWIILGIATIATATVFVMAQIKGSQRWIGFGPMRFQPSEFAKIAIILALAKTIEDRDAGHLTGYGLIAPLIAIVTPVGLIALQPDLGSASLTLLVILSVGFLVVRNLAPLIAATMAGIALLPLLWDRMHAYQQRRILCFLDPQEDPTGTCWNALQSIFAVGSGKIAGKGFMDSTQSRLSYLPEHWTDFPFSVFAEEWGFIGGVFVIVLFGFLIFWIVNVGLQARDRFGGAICIGVAAMLFWHVFVNIGMVIGIAPVVGVTLPFISYGGSSLVTFCMAMGLVSSVSLRRHGY